MADSNSSSIFGGDSKNKVIETPRFNIRGHLLRWEDTAIQISNIAMVTTGDLEDVFTLLRGFCTCLSIKSCEFQQFRKNQEQGVFPADTQSSVFFENRALRNFWRN